MNIIKQPFLPLFPYFFVKDGHPEASQLANRHYSRKKSKQRFVSPGERLIMLSSNLDWLFCWSKKQFRLDQQVGIECTLSRNESNLISSEIILMAEKEALKKWGQQRFFTFVDPTKVKSNNPGYCFLKAGWKRLTERTKKKKLIILEKT